MASSCWSPGAWWPFRLVHRSSVPDRVGGAPRPAGLARPAPGRGGPHGGRQRGRRPGRAGGRDAGRRRLLGAAVAIREALRAREREERRGCGRRAEARLHPVGGPDLALAQGSRRVGFTDAGWSSSVARRAHNPEVAGSNPAPATTQNCACKFEVSPSGWPEGLIAFRASSSGPPRLRCRRMVSSSVVGQLAVAAPDVASVVTGAPYGSRK